MNDLLQEPEEDTAAAAVDSGDEWTRLRMVVETRDATAAHQYLDNLPPGEITRLLGQIPQDEQRTFLNILSEEDAAQVLETLPELQAAQLMAALPAEEAATIFDFIHSDIQADLLDQLSDEQSEAILEELPAEDAKSIRFLANFDRDSAGGLMNTEYLAYREANSVDDVLNDLRQFADDYANYNVQYIYVVSSAPTTDDSDHKGDSEGRLVGVLPLRDLVLAPRGRRISQMMIENPISVNDSLTLDSLQRMFDGSSLFGLPVVDSDGMLVGVVSRSHIQHASETQAGRTFLRFAGILGGEELRSLPLKTRCGRRLSWLSINIVLNIVAASVISMYEETLSAVIALAVFLPMVSDMSGCSGNQAVAVSTRELVLGVIRPSDYLHVFRKEVLLGLINGIALGILLGIVAYVWKGIPALGLVVGGALAANTLIAVCLGALIPLLLKGFKLDPALASGPILTTLTDMCGFFLVLSFAQLMLPWLI